MFFVNGDGMNHDESPTDVSNHLDGFGDVLVMFSRDFRWTSPIFVTSDPHGPHGPSLVNLRDSPASWDDDAVPESHGDDFSPREQQSSIMVLYHVPKQPDQLRNRKNWSCLVISFAGTSKRTQPDFETSHHIKRPSLRGAK